jgi:SAM-dependent methyltransferase
VTRSVRKLIFETLYRNRWLYHFASTIPFAGQWRVWQRLVLPRLQGHDVLELGCGLGDLLADMLVAGYNCQAVEYSAQMAAAARETLRRRVAGAAEMGETVKQGSTQNLPFASESFDTVVSTFPSEYIHDPATLAEVARVLRPGGRLIVIEGAYLLPVGIVQSVLVLGQTLMYGQSPESTAKKVTRQQGVVSEIVENAWFGRHIPLEKVGMHRTSEIVRSWKWEVFITMGEKK